MKKLLLCATAFSGLALSAQPILNSLPGSDYVIFLDFDGATVSGTSWNTLYTSGANIVASASSQNSSGISETWRHVSEDFRAFNINVTTDSTEYNSAAAGERIWVVITPSSGWFGVAGGVAFLNSFTWGSKTPVWAFENYLGYTAQYIAECTSHEVGHSLGLYHQSYYNGSCVKTEYNPGAGSGAISWAPIMGEGYYKNVTTWYNSTSSNGCSTYQDDIAEILTNGFGLRSDDYGNTRPSAGVLTIPGFGLDTAGIINDSNDIDYMRFNVPFATSLSINANPFTTQSGTFKSNVDLRLELRDSAGTLIASADSSTILNAFIINRSVGAGTYYIAVDGMGSTNYTDYSSMGRYTISISSTVALPLYTVHAFVREINSRRQLMWECNHPEDISYAQLQLYDGSGEYNEFHTLQKGESFELYNHRDIQYARVKVYFHNGESATSEVLNVAKASNTLFPNPNQGYARLGCGNCKSAGLTIYNQYGQEVYSKGGEFHEFGHLPSDVYFYRVWGEEIKGKLVIQ